MDERRALVMQMGSIQIDRYGNSRVRTQHNLGPVEVDLIKGFDISTSNIVSNLPSRVLPRAGLRLTMTTQADTHLRPSTPFVLIAD
jgi:hypothetical protein